MSVEFYRGSPGKFDPSGLGVYTHMHCPLLSQADAEGLNEVDRRARSDAYRAGHSRVSATSPALNARGIAIGQSSR